MATLFRNSRSIITGLSCIRRTAATATTAGTQVKTSGTPPGHSQTSRPAHGIELAVRDARQRVAPADAIKPRAAGEPPLIPLVGKALNVWGQIGFGVVLALSAYFIYINYVTNPEFYKSLKLSREVGKKSSHEQSAKHEEAAGH